MHPPPPDSRRIIHKKVGLKSCLQNYCEKLYLLPFMFFWWISCKTFPWVCTNKKSIFKTKQKKKFLQQNIKNTGRIISDNRLVVVSRWPGCGAIFRNEVRRRTASISLPSNSLNTSGEWRHGGDGAICKPTLYSVFKHNLNCFVFVLGCAIARRKNEFG